MLGLTAIASNNVWAVGAISSQTFTSAHWNGNIDNENKLEPIILHSTGRPRSCRRVAYGAG